MKIVFLFMAIGLMACNNASKVNSGTGEAVLPAGNTDTTSIAGADFLIDSSKAVLPGESVIQEIIPAENLPIVNLQKEITGINQSIRLTITDMEPGQLKIRINPKNPEANIRISRVILPDGTTDGPFGRELQYNITQRGNFVVIIRKSNMASGSPVGELSIQIER